MQVMRLEGDNGYRVFLGNNNFPVSADVLKRTKAYSQWIICKDDQCIPSKKPLEWLHRNAASYKGTFRCECTYGPRKGEKFEYTV